MIAAAGDILRVACEWLIDGTDQIVNVHTLHLLDLGGATSDAELMDMIGVALADELYDTILSTMADNITSTLIRAIDLSVGGVLPPAEWSADGTGSASEVLPHQVTGLVFLNGSQPRRQGRTYLPPLKEDDSTDTGLWSLAAYNAMLNFAATLLDPIGTVDVQFERVISNAAGSSWFLPTQAGVSASPRTQRRRTLGRGA